MKNLTLREAHSTPHIGTSDNESLSKKNNKHEFNRLNNISSEKCFTCAINSNKFSINSNNNNFKRSFFNTNFSSSSTDLINIIQFYNESGNPEIIKKWIDLYKIQKKQLINQLCFKSIEKKNYYESAENIYRKLQCSLSCNSSASTIAVTSNYNGNEIKENLKYSINRSMDVLPRSQDHFRLLERCCSADIPTFKQIQLAKLARSKEMPNIADVDDYD